MTCVVDGELYCDDCAPDHDPEDECWSSIETDTPSHCTACHQPLDYTLTQDGVRYVVDSLVDHTRDLLERLRWRGPCTWTWNDGWYEGLDAFAVLEDWADELNHYILERQDRRIVERFQRVLDRYERRFGRAPYYMVLPKTIERVQNHANQQRRV